MSDNRNNPHHILELQRNLTGASLQRNMISDYAIKSDDHVINVLQWNILAQALSYPEGNFNRVTNDIVNYETRKWRILEQILIHNPDLCALEEVDIYDCFLKEHLPRYGYNCYFTPKPNSRCLIFEGVSNDFKGPDGTLLCYKRDLFEEKGRKSSDLPNDGRAGRQVFSIYELIYKPLSLPIVFVGTHFKAKKQFANSRTNQAHSLIKCLTERYSKSENIIIAGDFNGDPEEQFYDILHRAGFRSAYRNLMNNQEPPYTTWKFKAREGDEKEECKTIDYIFYRSNHLDPIAYLEIPKKVDIGPNALPSIHYPSDHLALQSIFRVQS